MLLLRIFGSLGRRSWTLLCFAVFVGTVIFVLKSDETESYGLQSIRQEPDFPPQEAAGVPVQRHGGVVVDYVAEDYDEASSSERQGEVAVKRLVEIDRERERRARLEEEAKGEGGGGGGESEDPDVEEDGEREPNHVDEELSGKYELSDKEKKKEKLRKAIEQAFEEEEEAGGGGEEEEVEEDLDSLEEPREFQDIKEANFFSDLLIYVRPPKTGGLTFSAVLGQCASDNGWKGTHSTNFKDRQLPTEQMRVNQ